MLGDVVIITSWKSESTSPNGSSNSSTSGVVLGVAVVLGDVVVVGSTLGAGDSVTAGVVAAGTFDGVFVPSTHLTLILSLFLFIVPSAFFVPP